jgi:DNA-binding response OmpR family regulator
MRLLLVEDEPRLATALARGLRSTGFAVDVARDGATALAKAGVHDYSVIVLDRDLPAINGSSVNGDDVCRRLAADRVRGRILMVTAANAVEDRVAGLELGADDYMAKPFDFRELVARIRALGRRSCHAAPPILRRAGIELDPARHEASRDGRPISLQRKEFAVLEVLLEAAGAVVSAETLLARVWDENVDPFSNVVRVVVMTLRRKLGPVPVIETVAGVGYRIA